jgi:hypothetical protein
MNTRARLVLLALLLALTAGVVTAQRRGRYMNPNIQTAREAEQNSVQTPNWENPEGFKKDVFTFVRIKYSTHGRRGSNGYWFGSGRWAIDFPDADLNISYRLQQMTSLKVDPNGRVLEITDPELFNYPFIYIVEPGDLAFTDEEVPILRRYLLNGGFLMVDDFWGEDEYENFYNEMKRVFPEREPVDLTRDHPIFHAVFDIRHIQNLQIPNIGLGTASQWNGGVTWERHDAEEVHYRAFFDDKQRIMVMICHNTDLGDGWEREGENEYYFKEFSEKKAYPLGINIIFYAMTH